MKKIFLTIILSLLAINFSYAQKLDRGADIFNTENVFIPKGNLLVGGTFSYRKYDFNNYKFIVFDEIQAGAYNFKLAPQISYFFANNMAAGVKFTYSRSSMALDALSLDIPELDLGMDDINRVSHTYYISGIYRNYIPLGSSLRFALFTEIGLNFGMGQNKFTDGLGAEMTGTFQETLELGIGVVPGVAVFISDEVAVEASIGIMGLKYKKVTQITNQVKEGTYVTSSADFRIDLLSINIGISFAIPI